MGMKPNPRKYDRVRRRLLVPLAQRYRLDYDQQVMYPGSTEPEVAYQLAGCGADLLSALRYSDSVPTVDARTAASVAKLVDRSFGSEGGQHAATFLAQAFAVWMVEMMSRAGDEDSATTHAMLRDLVQEFFPIDASDLERIEELRAEYRVLDTHEIAGRHPATGWYMAQLDADFAEGRDPATDPDLIQTQLRYASRYLRLRAECRAIEICSGSAYEAIATHLVYPPYWAGHEMLLFDRTSMAWWTCPSPRRAVAAPMRPLQASSGDAVTGSDGSDGSDGRCANAIVEGSRTMRRSRVLARSALQHLSAILGRSVYPFC
jgi:hypothetical protein